MKSEHTSLSSQASDWLSVIPKRLVVIGNSHAHSFSNSPLAKYGLGQNSDDEIASFSLGPLSAKNLVREKFSILTRTINSLNSDEDVVMLALGEADCRFYLPSSYPLPEIQESIDSGRVPDCILESKNFLRTAYEFIHEQGFETVVWAGHPSTEMAETADPNMPAVGRPELRRTLSWHWAKSSLDIANELKAVHLDPFEELSLQEFPPRSLFIDQIHLDPEWLRAKIRSSLLEAGLRLTSGCDRENSDSSFSLYRKSRTFLSDKRMRLTLKRSLGRN